MNPRALVLIAMVVGLFLLLFALVRWGQDLERRSRHRQQLAQQERTSTDRGFFAASVPSNPSVGALSAPPTPGPFRALSPAAPAALPRIQVGYPAPERPSQVVSYLNTISAVERNRQTTWGAWWKFLSPPQPIVTGNATGSNQTQTSASPELAPPDLMAAAALWDKSLSGSLPDSTCLPFHIAYLHYLALEKDYLRRMTLLQQEGSAGELAALQKEMQETLPAAALRVQAKLRELQHDHPELAPELQKLQVQSYLN
ncbi:hypothetical protein [Armatimonas rosea]|uniref:Lipase chaperone n=1 Tax=Armatimonas rosea TaxID=685828 RepID=A0A7W9SQK4_ARMRO|nr:hypothetical protein [Armatimonas rosea]MBB6050378.1 hypothetical protein [Armatimonas rosea]